MKPYLFFSFSDQKAYFGRFYDFRYLDFVTNFITKTYILEKSMYYYLIPIILLGMHGDLVFIDQFYVCFYVCIIIPKKRANSSKNLTKGYNLHMLFSVLFTHNGLKS